MYLLDTNIISELRRPRPHGAVTSWLDSIRPAKLCLSVVTIGEIQAGVERVRPNDPEKAGQIEAWLDHALTAFEILPIDAAIIRLWAKHTHGRPGKLYEDALIAATAITAGLTIATRNIKDFQDFGAKLVNPFSAG
jgi:predicted nucleic acid-binding protein